MATTVALTQKLRADDIFSPQWRCSFSASSFLASRRPTSSPACYAPSCPIHSCISMAPFSSPRSFSWSS